MLLREALNNYSLADISPDQVHLAQQAAVVRLHLFVLGEVHQRITQIAGEAWRLAPRANDNTPLNRFTASRFTQALTRAWDQFVPWYTELLTRSMYTAASFPFGVWAIMHEDYLRPHLTTEESGFARMVGDIVQRGRVQRIFADNLNPDPVFQPQLEEIIQAAHDRTWGDGLQLSGRIWRLDKFGRDGLNTAVNLAAERGYSAWQLATNIEQFLGAGADCPRWTRDRLSSLTKQDIADGDRTGLFSGDECSGQGVSYNALRLARTEIQAILNMSTVRMFKQIPWIEEEQINLSPEHAVVDQCDDVVTGGENGDGTYPVGDITLPLHPHCLCFRTAVLMDPTLFVSKLRGWMASGEQWPQMDDYKQTLGGDLNVDLRGSLIGLSLAYWLWGDSVDLGGLFWNMALGR